MTRLVVLAALTSRQGHSVPTRPHPLATASAFLFLKASAFLCGSNRSPRAVSPRTGSPQLLQTATRALAEEEQEDEAFDNPLKKGGPAASSAYLDRTESSHNV